MPARRKKKSLFANEEKKGKGELVPKYIHWTLRNVESNLHISMSAKANERKYYERQWWNRLLTGISSWNVWPWPWGLIYENIKNFLQVFHVHDKTNNLFIQWPWTIFCCILLSPAIYIFILQHCQVQLLDISSQVSPWTV